MRRYHGGRDADIPNNSRSKLLLIFNASEAMLQIGVPALRMISLCFIPAAVGIMLSTLFQAVGNGMYSLIVSVLRQLAALVPLAYLLSRIGGLELIWYAFPLAEVASLVASLFLTAAAVSAAASRAGYGYRGASSPAEEIDNFLAVRHLPPLDKQGIIKTILPSQKEGWKAWDLPGRIKFRKIRAQACVPVRSWHVRLSFRKDEDEEMKKRLKWQLLRFWQGSCF